MTAGVGRYAGMMYIRQPFEVRDTDESINERYLVRLYRGKVIGDNHTGTRAFIVYNELNVFHIYHKVFSSKCSKWELPP